MPKTNQKGIKVLVPKKDEILSIHAGCSFKSPGNLVKHTNAQTPSQTTGSSRGRGPRHQSMVTEVWVGDHGLKQWVSNFAINESHLDSH